MIVMGTVIQRTARSKMAPEMRFVDSKRDLVRRHRRSLTQREELGSKRLQALQASKHLASKADSVRVNQGCS
jgi:hypothetical protein